MACAASSASWAVEVSIHPGKGLEHRRTGGERGERIDLVDENIAGVARIDRCLGWSGVAGDDDTAVGRIEPIAVALHRVPGGEGCYGDVCILVDNAGCDLMRVDPRSFRKLALVSMWICAGLDVLPVSEKDVLGHRLDPLGPWTSSGILRPITQGVRMRSG